MSAPLKPNSNSTAKHLLVYCPSDTWGGIEKNVHLRVKAMLARGYRVTLVLLDSTFKNRFSDCPGLDLLTLPMRHSDLNPNSYRTLATLIREIRPDCLFVPIKQDWWVASLCAHWLGVPRTVLYLGIKRRLKANLKYRLIFQRFGAHLLVNSRDLKRSAQQSLPWLNTHNTHLIYNGFTLPTLQSPYDSLKTRLGLPGQTILIGCAGRLSRQKGFDLLPEIIKKLPSQVHVVIAGQGEQEATLRVLFEAENVSERLHLIGNQTEMADFYRSLDVFLLTSRNEGMANVLNEAMCYGLPVVSTDAPGSAELLGFERTTASPWPADSLFLVGPQGLLTPMNAPTALAAALIALIERKHVYSARQQRRKIEQHHSLNSMMDRTEQLFFP